MPECRLVHLNQRNSTKTLAHRAHPADDRPVESAQAAPKNLNGFVSSIPRYGPPRGEFHPKDAALETFAALKLHEQDTMSPTALLGTLFAFTAASRSPDPAFRAKARASLQSEAIEDMIDSLAFVALRGVCVGEGPLMNTILRRYSHRFNIIRLDASFQHDPKCDVLITSPLG
jgi:hypothetical protein